MQPGRPAQNTPIRVTPCRPTICRYQYYQCYSYCNNLQQRISYSTPKPFKQRSESSSEIEVSSAIAARAFKILLQMNDMDLTSEQMKFFSNKSLSRTFHISIDWLWNRNWNAIENKYLIPFTVHPVRQAQYQISKVHRHLESVVGTIKFVRRSFEKSYIQ